MNSSRGCLKNDDMLLMKMMSIKRYRLFVYALPLLAGCSTLSGMWQKVIPQKTISITETGVGGLTANTPMDIQQIASALPGRYQLLDGMQTNNGKIEHVIEVRKAGTVVLQISGEHRIDRISVLDPALMTSTGINVGTAFHKIYQKAYNVCRRTSQSPEDVVCQAPGSQHIHYLFSGQWQGPENLLPADDVLKNWTISEIIWQ